MISPNRADRFSTISTSGSTARSSEFVDETFEVIPVKAQVNQTEEKAPESQGLSNTSIPDDYTEEDLMFISESMASLPSIFLPKIPLRTQEQLTPFNHQFYRYCRKKGINPFEFFFDEFGLLMAGAGLAGGIWRDYKDNYGSGKKEESKQDKKLSAEYEHEKQVAEQKEKDIREGKITAGGPA